MGVDRTDYIIHGFKFDPKKLKKYGIDIWDNKFMPFIEGHPGIQDIIVYDGMSGEYLVFGKLINRSEEHMGVNFTTISFKDFFYDEENERLTQQFKELFGAQVYSELEENEPQVYVFSHYS